jgi:thioredoxin reductase
LLTPAQKSGGTVIPSADGKIIRVEPLHATQGRGGALDDKGVIKTGPDLSPEDLAAAYWPVGRPPYLLETSLPAVFAVGDVRGGNIKRVASAVGEGSIAVPFVHRVLHE